MPSISLVPADRRSARLVTALPGSEWFEFEAELAAGERLRLEPEGRAFPTRGTVSIRRGLDHEPSGDRIADTFRYIESCTDSETGAHVDERFGVTLFMPAAAFDRLAQRAQWGLPALVLSFDAGGAVVTGAAGDLCFRRQARSWEQIAGATLTQRLQ